MWLDIIKLVVTTLRWHFALYWNVIEDNGDYALFLNE